MLSNKYCFLTSLVLFKICKFFILENTNYIIVQFDVRPTHRVGVIGIGGLGHMALQFLNKWGCEVTAFSSSSGKDAEAFQMIMGQRSISGSPLGSPATIQDMLQFCVRHNIMPLTEHFAMKDVNKALEHLRAGKARYRVGLDN